MVCLQCLHGPRSFRANMAGAPAELSVHRPLDHPGTRRMAECVNLLSPTLDFRYS